MLPPPASDVREGATFGVRLGSLETAETAFLPQ